MTSDELVTLVGRDACATSKPFERDGRRAATRMTCARYENVCRQHYTTHWKENHNRKQLRFVNIYIYIIIRKNGVIDTVRFQ